MAIVHLHCANPFLHNERLATCWRAVHDNYAMQNYKILRKYLSYQ